MGRKPRTDVPATRRIKFAATPLEVERWQQAARADGVTLSEFIRLAIDARALGLPWFSTNQETDPALGARGE